MSSNDLLTGVTRSVLGNTKPDLFRTADLSGFVLMLTNGLSGIKVSDNKICLKSYLILRISDRILDKWTIFCKVEKGGMYRGPAISQSICREADLYQLPSNKDIYLQFYHKNATILPGILLYRPHFQRNLRRPLLTNTIYVETSRLFVQQKRSLTLK